MRACQYSFSAMSLSDREWDDLKLLLDKAVYKFLGFSEPSLVTAALNCIDKGFDEGKTAGKQRPGPKVMKLLMLNSAEQDIYPAY